MHFYICSIYLIRLNQIDYHLYSKSKIFITCFLQAKNCYLFSLCPRVRQILKHNVLYKNKREEDSLEVSYIGLYDKYTFSNEQIKTITSTVKLMNT